MLLQSDKNHHKIQIGMQIQLNEITRLLSITLLYILLVQCSADVSEIPQTDNETFNRLLQKAPATIIDLDNIPVDTIKITSNQMLGTESSDFFSEPVYLQPPMTSLILQKDSVYVVNRQKIFVMDNDGVWQRSVGGQGNGPGEYNSYVNIASNSTQIFGFDYGNSRIHVYDKELNLIRSIKKLMHLQPHSKNYFVSDDRLFMGIYPYPNNNLIGIYSLNDLENEVETFWPKIIPNGMQPAPYNNILFDVNTKNTIAITNPGLPYLFLLGPDLNIEHILYFDSSYYEEFDNPSAIPAQKIKNRQNRQTRLGLPPGVQSFISNLQLDDDRSIYFRVGLNLYKIIIDDNTYRLSRAWHFIHTDPVLIESSPKGITINVMAIEEDVLYFLSHFAGGYVFKVPLNE